MTDEQLSAQELSILGKSMMPKDLYLDLRRMYDGLDEELCNELADAIEDEEKWNTFADKYDLEYKPLAKIEGGEIKDSGKVLKFNSPEEQDAWLKEQGLLE